MTLTQVGNVLTVAGGDLAVPDDAYGAGWNGSVNVPTKNAIYDKLSLVGQGLTWNTLASGGSVTMAVNNGYVAESGVYSTQTLTLPATSAVGDIVVIQATQSSGLGSTAKIAQAASQYILFNVTTTQTSTTVGVTGYLQTQSMGSIILVCTVANVGWQVHGMTGRWSDQSGNLTSAVGIDPIVVVTTTGTQTLTNKEMTTIQLGHASDTTLSRSSAGVMAVEGVVVPTISSSDTLSNKTLSSPILSGPLSMSENSSITLDPAGSADGKYSGIAVQGTAGYTQAFGDLVYLDPTDSRWEAADANAAAAADGDSRGILGMVVSAGTDGSTCLILLQGIIRADANFPALTINAPVYVAETAGDIVVTQPVTADVVIRVVGFAITADEIYFNPSPDYITHT